MSDETDYLNVKRGLEERGVPELQRELWLTLIREADAIRDRQRAIAEMIFPPKVRR